MSDLNILKGEVRENTGKSFTKSVRKEGNIPVSYRHLRAHETG